MLKSNYKNSIITNSSIELQGDLSLEGNGKGRKFVSRFIEPGIAEYKGTFGKILITKETLDSFIMSMVGCPVIIKHKDITDKNVDQERVGVVSEVWYNEADGWYYCSGILFDKQAIDLVKNQGWSVSCTYDFETDNTKGTYHGLDYDMQFTGGEFLHLALVPNPRYERANIVVNSKDEEQTAEDKMEVQNSLDTVLNAISEVFVECLGELRNSFPDHEGRPGKVGGSLPRGESSKKDNDLDYSYEAQKDNLIMLGITEAEFMDVVSLINTEYDKKYANTDIIKHFTPVGIYYAENHGFNNYLFCGIKFNDGTENEWFI